MSLTPFHTAAARPWVAALIALSLLTFTSPVFAGWEEVDQDEGVTVYRKDIAGRDLPVFKGVMTMNVGVVHILAVLDDVPGSTNWMHNCIEASLVKQTGAYERIVYNRTDAPWPVSDRDVVLNSKVTVNKEKKTVTINFHSIQDRRKGEVEDVVRMPRLKGHYKFTVLSKDKTRVEYQIDADPGGSLPDFVINMASRDLPIYTLVNLQKKAIDTSKSGKYKAFVTRWSAEFGLE